MNDQLHFAPGVVVTGPGGTDTVQVTMRQGNVVIPIGFISAHDARKLMALPPVLTRDAPLEVVMRDE